MTRAELVSEPGQPIDDETLARLAAHAGDRAFADWDESLHPRDERGRFATVEEQSSDAKAADGDIKFETFRYDREEGFKSTAQVFENASKTLGVNAEGLARSMTRAFASAVGSTNSSARINDALGLSVQVRADGVTFKREFSRDDGKLVVEHQAFELPPSAQGQGTGTRLLAKSLEVYERYGVDRIDLYANVGVGGYAWAKLGFKATAPDEFLGHVNERFKNQYGATAPRHIMDSWREVVRRAEKAGNDAPSVIANSPFGKKALLGSEWLGYMNLKGSAGEAFKVRVRDKAKAKG